MAAIGNATFDGISTATPTPSNAFTERSASASDFYEDQDAFVYDLLGPQRDSLKIVVPVTVIYTLIFVSGVVGNIGTCVVIKKNRSMHTATNYYLFSLAVSDFLLLLSGVPQEMYFIWSKYPYVFGEWFCIGRGVIAEMSANATVLTITAFTVERYVAICHPFLGKAMSKLNRAIRIIGLIWLVAIVTAVPQAAQFGIETYHGVRKCVVVREIIQHSFQLSTYIFFLAPMSIIVVLYLLIGLRLYRSDMIGGRPTSGRSGKQHDTILYRYAGGGSGTGAGGGAGSGSASGSGAQLSAVRGRMNQYGTRRVLKMLVAVVICFFLCWAPFHAQRLFAVYGTDVMGSADYGSSSGIGSGSGSVEVYAPLAATNDDVEDDNGGPAEGSNHEEIIYTVMTYVSGVLYYLSTCINPLLYNIMSNKFREAFKAILFGKMAKGSTSSRRTQESSSRRLRRHPTLTSTSQRESLERESDLQAKNTLTVLHERKMTTSLNVL